jgi:hypothetical protein
LSEPQSKSVGRGAVRTVVIGGDRPSSMATQLPQELVVLPTKFRDDSLMSFQRKPLNLAQPIGAGAGTGQPAA